MWVVFCYCVWALYLFWILTPSQTYGLHAFLPRLEVAISFVVGFLCWALSCGAIHALIFALFLLWVLWRAQGTPSLTAQGLLPAAPAPLPANTAVWGSFEAAWAWGDFYHRGLPPLPAAPTLATRRCFPSERASPTCKGCVLLAISGLPPTGLCQPPPRSCPPHVHFQSLCFTLAPTFPGKWSFEKDLVVLTWYLGRQRHKFWFTQSPS